MTKALKDLTEEDLQQISGYDLLKQALDSVIEAHPGNDPLKQALLKLTNHEVNLALDEDFIGVHWGIEDVKDRATTQFGMDERVIPDDEAAREILFHMKQRHDCNFGITWETIDVYLQEYELEYIGCIPEEELPLYMNTVWVWHGDVFKERIQSIKKETVNAR
jgi:hypothetical protein